jgi:menaquinone-dependent protoporphyrinogen oxidase
VGVRALILYGAKHGGIGDIAEEIASVLRNHGIHSDVRLADEVDDLGDYDAVVLGGARQADHWNRATRRFVTAHLDALRQRPTWFFSASSHDDPGISAEIPPVDWLAHLTQRVGAIGEATFEADADDVVAWASQIAAELTSGPPAEPARQFETGSSH